MRPRRRLQRWLESTATAVKAGTFVEWPASKGTSRGKVVSVHTSTKVPGTVTKIEGTSGRPAARVRLYAKSGEGWEPTSVYLAHYTDQLTGIDPLPEPAEPAKEAVVQGSFEQVREEVEQAIRGRIEQVTGVCPDGCYVYDCGPTWAVYRINWDSDYWMIEYTRSDAGEITLGDAIEVVKVTSYQPVDEPGEAVTEAVDRVEGRLLAARGTSSDGSRVYAVQLINYGDSKNGRRYPESVMRTAAPLYEGAKAYDHHRTDAEIATSTIAGLVGHYRNVEATGTGLAADLHLLPSATHTAEALDASLANQAAGLPALVGISHDVLTLSKPITVDGRQFRECTAIRSVNSADVVADPAAGGQATRMVAGGPGDPNPTNKEKSVNLKQLLELLRGTESAARPALLTEHAHVIESAGYTADDVTRLVEASTPAPASAGGTIYAKGEFGARILVAHVVKEAKLPELVGASILEELPAQFTEAELTTRVESARRLIEGLERANLRPGVPAVEVGQEALDKKIARLDATFAGDFSKGYRSFKEAFYDITGRHPVRAWDARGDENRTILRESVSLMIDGERQPFQSDLIVERGTESVQAGTWGNILGDSMTRRMVAEYSQPSLASWRQVVSSIVPVNDFRTQRIERLGGYGTLPTVLEGGPYQPLTTPGNDAEVTYALNKKGGTEDLTLETIANDDLRAIIRIPAKLGLAAAQTLYRFVFDFFPVNPVIYDGTALFASGHTNTDTNALSGANVSIGRKKMRKQTAYGDTANVLSIVPKLLLTCSDLEELAWELCTSAVALPSGAPVGAATNVPNIHQGLTPLVVDYWSSTTEWHMVADPAMVPTIEVGFYQGRQDPEIFVQNDPNTGSVFNADKVTYKIRHIYSGAVLDYRGMYRGNA